MNKKDRIATYFANARELIKKNNPQAARAYVLELLDEALETYHAATTIVSKAKTAVFMERWIQVSRDLYDKGITDYVLECFELSVPTKEQPSKKEKPIEKAVTPAPEQAKSFETNSDIDISGLVEEVSKTQGWCAEVFEANSTAVVEIAASTRSGKAGGTGFIISKNGYLLTNDHVVFDDENGVYDSRVAMSFIGGKKKIKLEVLFSDKNADIALCKFDPSEAPSFTIAKRITDYSSVKQGADCLVIGNTFGMGLAPFTGIIRYTRNSNGNMVYTAPSNPGDSGGPVFNRKGECIGINKSKTLAVNGAAADGYANATPMDKINELLKKWTTNNDITL